jgi:hypothetical protein
MPVQRQNSGARRDVFARDWLCKHVFTATESRDRSNNWHTTIENLLEAVFSVGSVTISSSRCDYRELRLA